MVSHYVEPKIVGVDSYYAITVDCITEGKGDVKWMKCSHTKNVASVFPLTCECGEFSHVIKQVFAKEDKTSPQLVDLL